MPPEPERLMKISLHGPIESPGKTKATKVPQRYESVRFEYRRTNATLDISFRRTVRVPDNDRRFELPPDGGAFPLFSVNRYRKQLPAEIADKGGVFLPVRQREAMWIDFTCKEPFAVKVYVGGVNAVSGEPRDADFGTLLRRSSALDRGECIQDYLVAHKQYWIDGVAERDGSVRQFVATPTGTGYSVEAQVTGLDSVCGIQLEVVPCRTRKISVRVRLGSDETSEIWFSVKSSSKCKKLIDAYCDAKGINPCNCTFLYDGYRISREATVEEEYTEDCDVIEVFEHGLGGGPGGSGNKKDTQPWKPKETPKKVQEMVVAPGGLIKQTIIKDTLSPTEWDTENAIITNISLINASSFKYITGFNAPRTPITAATYAREGLPFFKMYKEPSGIKGNFRNLRSVADLDRAKNENAEVHEAEKDLDFPVVEILKKRSSFVPVEELERRAKRVRVSSDL